MTSFQRLIDVADPPAGFEFSRGIWFTHDLDPAVLASQVASRLVGIGSYDPRQQASIRTASTSSGERPALHIVAAFDRISTGWSIPWIRTTAVTGRRQHAKFGVLEFVDPKKGTNRVIRSFVTSGNLTRGGLSTNCEVLLVEDRKASSVAKGLAGDLLAAIGAWLKSDATGINATERKALRAAHKALRTTCRIKRAHSVTHSLDKARSMVETLGQFERADRVVIVAPSFAGNTDEGPLEALSSMIDEQTVIDWHIGGRAGAPPAVPERIYDGLSAVDGTPPNLFTLDDRVLHAKFIGCVRSSVANVVLGSANFTSNGLFGKNRELIVHGRLPLRDFDALVDGLGTNAYDGNVRHPEPNHPPAAGPSFPLPTFVVEGPFETGLDEVTTGVLRVEDRPPGVKIEVFLHGRWRPVTGKNTLRVPIEGGTLRVRFTTGAKTRELHVPLDTSTCEPELWGPAEDWLSGIPPELKAILRLARIARPASSGSGADSKGGLSDRARTLVKDQLDSYIESLQQPLVIIARYRKQLSDLLPDHAANIEAAIAAISKHRPPLWDAAVEERLARILIGLDKPTTNLEKALVNVGAEHG